jgi:FkbM family methyltransferase
MARAGIVDLPLRVRVPADLREDLSEPALATLETRARPFVVNTSARHAMDDLAVSGQVAKDYFGYEVALARRGGVVPDVGAHVGMYALLVALAEPTIEVHALEPVSACYQAALRNVVANGPRGRVRIVHAAIGALTEHRKIALTYGGRQSTLAADRLTEARTGSEEEVEVLRLDDYCARAGIEAVDVLKVDVEGFEVEVLSGASQILEKTRLVVLEWHSRDRASAVDALLRAAGLERIAPPPDVHWPSGSLGIGYWMRLREGDNRGPGEGAR